MHRLELSALALIFSAASLSSCGGVNNALANKKESVEYYRIYDVKTSAARQVVAKAATDGLGQNTSNVTTAKHIAVSADLPDKPGRFKVVDPLAGSKLGLLAGSGLGLKAVECDGAAWTGKAVRTITGSNTLNLWTCLFQYQSGYHLDMYATFAKVEGGLQELSRQMAYAAVGTPEEWTEKVFADVLRQIHGQTGATITYVEGDPDPGPLPWLDRGGQPAQPASAK